MCLINANQKIIMIIINTQITNILTNIKDSDNHGTKYKHFPQFPGEEIPRKCTVSAEPWVNRRHLPPSHLSPPSPPPSSKKKNIYIYIPQRETRRKFPILRNEQIHTVYKQSQKIQNAHNFLFLQIYLYIAEK